MFCGAEAKPQPVVWVSGEGGGCCVCVCGGGHTPSHCVGVGAWNNLTLDMHLIQMYQQFKGMQNKLMHEF